jgi:predicted transcriptional regulator
MSICVGLSAKFEKELSHFITWMPSTEYNLSDVVDGSKVNWNDVVLSSFKEPARNKLESFIKELMKVYFLNKNGNEITDVKLIAKEFRETPKKEIKKESKKQTKKETSKKETSKKETSKKETSSVIVDNTLNTLEAFFLRALPYWTEELVKCFGKPIYVVDDEYEYEWKLMIGSKVFSIHNLINEDDFEENEWYLAGFEKRSQEEKDLLSYIDNFIKNKPLGTNTKSEKKVQDKIEDVQDKIEDVQDKIEDVQDKIEDVQDKIEDELDDNIDRDIEDKIEDELDDNIDRDIDVDIEDKIDIELDLIDDDDIDINIDDIDFDF